MVESCSVGWRGVNHSLIDVSADWLRQFHRVPEFWSFRHTKLQPEKWIFKSKSCWAPFVYVSAHSVTIVGGARYTDSFLATQLQCSFRLGLIFNSRLEFQTPTHTRPRRIVPLHWEHREVLGTGLHRARAIAWWQWHIIGMRSEIYRGQRLATLAVYSACIVLCFEIGCTRRWKLPSYYLCYGKLDNLLLVCCFIHYQDG